MIFICLSFKAMQTQIDKNLSRIWLILTKCATCSNIQYTFDAMSNSYFC